MFSCGRFCVSSVARIVPSSSLWQSSWTRLVARWDPNRFYHDRICVRYHLEANGCCLVFWPCTRCIRWRPSSLGDDIDAATQKKKKRIIGFILEYAVYLVNRLLYKKKKGPKMEKLNPRWEYGTVVGVGRRSNEVMVVTEEGLEEARSVKRIPGENRWGRII